MWRDVPALRNKTPDHLLHFWNPIHARLHGFTVRRDGWPGGAGNDAVGVGTGNICDHETLCGLVGPWADGEVPGYDTGGDDDYDEY